MFEEKYYVGLMINTNTIKKKTEKTVLKIVKNPFILKPIYMLIYIFINENQIYINIFLLNIQIFKTIINNVYNTGGQLLQPVDSL